MASTWVKTFNGFSRALIVVVRTCSLCLAHTWTLLSRLLGGSVRHAYTGIKFRCEFRRTGGWFDGSVCPARVLIFGSIPRCWISGACAVIGLRLCSMAHSSDCQRDLAWNVHFDFRTCRQHGLMTSTSAQRNDADLDALIASSVLTRCSSFASVLCAWMLTSIRRFVRYSNHFRSCSEVRSDRSCSHALGIEPGPVGYT